ncbi:MAG: CoA-binding protein [Candidatus Anstonellales archaeon]
MVLVIHTVSDEELRLLLSISKTIAVVGCSSNPQKEAHRIPKYLQDNGYRIIPINPNQKEILGETAYPSLSALSFSPDIVNVFRPSQECPQIAREALKLTPRLLWLQLGIKNAEAEEIAKDAGIPFIQDRCIMLEHRRLFKNSDIQNF